MCVAFVRTQVVQLPEDRKSLGDSPARDQSPSIFAKAVNKGEQILRGLSAVPAAPPAKKDRGSQTEVKALTKERSGSMSKEHPTSSMKVEKQPSFGNAEKGASSYIARCCSSAGDLRGDFFSNYSERRASAGGLAHVANRR